jgi:PPE-repeat protein
VPAHKYDHAEDRGAGSLGFAGTVSKDSGQASGFTIMPSDDFGRGSNMPMLPHTWTPEDGKEIP